MQRARDISGDATATHGVGRKGVTLGHREWRCNTRFLASLFGTFCVLFLVFMLGGGLVALLVAAVEAPAGWRVPRLYVQIALGVVFGSSIVSLVVGVWRYVRRTKWSFDGQVLASPSLAEDVNLEDVVCVANGVVIPRLPWLTRFSISATDRETDRVRLFGGCLPLFLTGDRLLILNLQADDISGGIELMDAVAHATSDRRVPDPVICPDCLRGLFGIRWNQMGHLKTDRASLFD